MPLINSKMKQSVVGNFGKPRSMEQHIKLKDFAVEPERIPNKKKPRKVKRNNISEVFSCPFCQKELPVDNKLPRNFVFNRVNKCPSCGAIGDQECPACKKDTWLFKGIYKHQFFGCGFEGKKLLKKYSF